MAENQNDPWAVDSVLADSQPSAGGGGWGVDAVIPDARDVRVEVAEPSSPEEVTTDPVVTDTSPKAPWQDVLKAVPTNLVEGARQGAGGVVRALGESRPGDALYQMSATLQRTTKRPGTLDEQLGTDLAGTGSEIAKKARLNIQEATPDNLSFWQDATLNAAQSLGISIPGTAMSIATRNPVYGLGSMGLAEYGSSYDDARNRGLSPEDAQRYAGINAVIEVATEEVPLKILLKRNIPFFSRLVNFYGQELVQENLATALQSANEFITLKPDATFKDWATWMLTEGIPQTTASTLLAAGAQAGAAHVAHKAIDQTAKLMDREAKDRQAIEDISEAYRQSGTDVSINSIDGQAAHGPATEAIPGIAQSVGEITDSAPPYVTEEAQDAIPSESAVAGQPQETAPDVTGGTPEYIDKRLKRDTYRKALVRSLDRDFVEGGGISLVPDHTFKPVESDKPGEIPLMRTPSVHEPWVQSLLQDNGISVKDVRNAVDKALKGQPLGVRQARVVQQMLDQVTDERTHPTEIDAARKQLEDARSIRRWVNADLASAGEIDQMAEGAPDLAHAGELFDESEYAPEQTALDRVIYEVATEARDLGGDEAQIESLLESQAHGAEVLRQLVRYTESLRHAQEARTEQPAAEQGEPRGDLAPVPGTSTAETPSARQEVARGQTADLLGGKNLTAQAIHDRQQTRRQLERNAPDMGAGPGDLFSDRDKQSDIEDVRGVKERRRDLARRKRVAELSPEEMRGELLTHHKTGIPNDRAYDESEKNAVQVAIDVDSLKWVNDNLGHDAGDKLLRAIAQALSESGLDAYHISGDEFMVQGDDQVALERALDGVRLRLDNAKLVAETPDGVTVIKRGVHFSYGIGANRHEADQALNRAKADREAQGLRAARGQEPPGVERATQGQPPQEDRAPTEVTEEPAQPKTGNEPKRLEHALEAQPDPEPTEAQKEAGNYKKGHVTFQGLEITIENMKGAERSGIDRDGKPWSVVMPATYGYVRGTEGKDGDHVDVYLADGLVHDGEYSPKQDTTVWVIDQNDADTGKFDEHKAFIGFRDLQHVQETYAMAFSDGRAMERWGGSKSLRVSEFKLWLKEGNTKKPISDKPSLKSRKDWLLNEAPKPRSDYGAKNKLVTQSRADEIRAKLKAKLNQLNEGVDPEVLALGTELAVFHIEAGARKFADFSKAMVDDLGEKIRPYLKSLYLAARNWPGIDKAGMNTEAELDLMEQDGSPSNDEPVEIGKYTVKPGGPTGWRIQWEYDGSRYSREVGSKAQGLRQAEDMHRRDQEREAAFKARQEGAASAKGEPASSQEATGQSAPSQPVNRGESTKPETPAETSLAAAEFLRSKGLRVHHGKTNNGNEVWEVAGDTRAHKDTIKALGGRWYGPKKVWSFYKGDPTERLAERLGWAKSASLKQTELPAAAPTRAAGKGMLGVPAERWDQFVSTLDNVLRLAHQGNDPTSITRASKARYEFGSAILAAAEGDRDAAHRHITKAEGLLFNNWPAISDALGELADEIIPPSEAESPTEAASTPASHGATVATEEPSNVAPARPERPATADRGSDTRARPAGGADRGPVGARLAGPDEGTGEPGETAASPEGTDGEREPAAGRRPSGRSAEPSGGPRDSGTVRNQPRAAVTRRYDYTITDADDLGAGGLKTKYKHNVAAIRLVKELAREGRRAMPDEQAILAKYVGWGGIKGVFDPSNKEWTKEHAELNELLTEDEYEAARRSMLDAHYTSVPVVRGIWSGLQHLGFTGGRVLEPSIGTGNFIGIMPAEIRGDSSVFGVELDSITGQIVRQLYQRADIAAPKGFQEVILPSGSFDAAVGNPPFGNQKLYDKAHPEFKNFSIHNFFIAKSIDKLRPGGVMGVVVSRYFLDAINSPARSWIAERANLIGALRLPYTAFKGNANTEVVTDILFFQKLQEGERADDAWTHTDSISVNGREFTISRYFAQHPESVLGDFSTEGTMYSADSLTVTPTEGHDIETAIREAVERLPANVYKPYTRSGASGQEISTDEVPVSGDIPDTVKVGAYFVNGDGKLSRRISDASATQETGEPEKRFVLVKDLPATTEKRIRGMASVRQALRDLIKAELSNTADSRLAELRLRLNSRYDTFAKEFGHINSQANRRAFQEDPDLPLMESLEPGYDPGVSSAVAKKKGIAAKPATAGKAAIFKTRVLSPYVPTLHADNPPDALTASLNEHGKVDLDYMSQITGIERDALTHELAGMIYLDPSEGRWIVADEYLTGNVKAKLSEAKDAAAKDAKFRANVEALEKVQPPYLRAVDISVRLGSTWVPNDVVERFGKELLQAGNVRVSYQRAMGMWGFAADGVPDTVQNATWGTRRVKATDLVRDILNMKSPVVKDNHGTSEKPIWVVNEPETQAAQAKAEDIANKFKEWVWQDPARRDRLEKIYNDNYNTDRTRTFDGRHLTLPGKSPLIQLEDHQKAAVWRMLQERVVLLDHVVGAGKTYASVAAIMEMRRLGVARKPIVVVPNHLVRQWRDEFYKLYPNANILAATEKDFEKKHRQRLFSRITTGDWDSVIVGHSSFKKIGMPPDIEKRMLGDQLSEIADAIEEAKRERGDRNIIRDMERMKERIKAKLDRLADQGEKDKAVSFDELGADALFVDEAHAFKNLYYFSQMRGVAGLGSPEGSERAFDMFIKLRYLDERYAGKAVSVFATGTPVSNSLVEMYTMQRYLAYDELKARGIHHLDSWARVFGDVQNVYEVHPSGTGYRLKSRFAKFVNMPELMTLYRKFADVITLEDLKKAAAAKGKRWPTPNIKGGKPQLIVAERSKDQEQFFGVPELGRNPDGAIRFKYSDLIVREVPPQGDGMGPQFEVTDRGQSVAGPFDTRAEAETEANRLYEVPDMQYNKGSILDQFEHLAELNRKTNGKINALSITTKARKAGLDMRLIDRKYPDNPGSKVNMAINEMLRIHKEWSADRGTQLVFLDFSTPAAYASRAAANERKVWVRDPQNGGLTEIKATLHVFEGVDSAAFYLQQVGKGDGAHIVIWDAITGVRVGSIEDRKAAKAFLSEHVTPEWLAEKRGENDPLTQEVIDDWKADQEGEEGEDEASPEGEGEDKLSLEELFVMASGNAFSVYDDIKAKLIAQGVPEREIAFIHDYDTAEKKSKLYKAMNAGEVRILLGSTEKMGAGMNVQERLVGLHHLDAPWRPSDLEQREGRIIRRGNRFFERDPDGFEVEILRYATKQTYDTRMWQLIEHKARGVEQLRHADGTARVIDDISGEAANAADMKAAASGNPLILDEIKLRNEIKSLEAQEQAYNRALFDLQERAGYLEKADERYQAKAAQAQSWIDFAAQHPVEPFQYTTAKGKTITDKKDIGGPMNAAAGEAIKSAYSTDVAAGEYRGLQVSFTREQGYIGEYLIANIKREGGKRVPVAEYGKKDTFSATGLITRIDNYLRNHASEIPQLQKRLEDEKAELVRVRDELTKPFERKGQLNEARIKHRNVVRTLQKAGGIVELTPKQKADLAEAVAKRRAEQARQGPKIEDDGIDLAVPQGWESAGGMPVKRYTVNEIKLAIAPLTKNWKNAPPIHVVNSMKELPPRTLMKAMRLKAFGVRGAFVREGGKDSVYLVANNLPSIRMAEMTLLHEVVGHYGLRGAFGQEWDKELRKIYDYYGREKLAYLTEAYNLDLSKPGDQLKAADEHFARLAERWGDKGLVGRDLTLFERVMTAIRNMLRRLGFKLEMNRSEWQDLANAIKKARSYVETGSPTTGEDDANLAIETDAFRSWFQNSKVVDENGDPLVVYHGTANRHNVFRNEHRGKYFDNAVSKEGFFFTEDRDVAARFATFTTQMADARYPGHNAPGKQARVIAAYLSLQNPVEIDGSKYGWNYQSADEIAEEIKQAKAAGHDGAIIRGWKDGSGADVQYVAFRSDQIKSVDNRGTFDPSNPDIRLSTPTGNEDDGVSVENLGLPAFQRSSKDWLFDHFKSAKSVGLWSRTVGSMYHLAHKVPVFKPVFDAGQSFLSDFSRIAIEAEDKAPGLFRKMGTIKQVFQTGTATKVDVEAIAVPIYTGTVMDERVYEVAELRQRFKLNDAQIGLYEQAIAATRKSLDDVTTSALHRMLRAMGLDRKPLTRAARHARSAADFLEVVYQAALKPERQKRANAVKEIEAKLVAASDEAKPGIQAALERAHAAKVELDKDIENLYKMLARANRLKKEGYFPLMRFGRYSVDVVEETDGKPERVAFLTFETEAEAKAAARELKEEYPDATVTAGVMSQDGWRLFPGLTPDVVEAFARQVGADKSDLFQQYLKIAVGNRSALKRLIHRKKVPGFSRDVNRTLASFVLANARLSSANYNMPDMLEAIERIPKEQGDVKDQAVRLRDYLVNPTEEFAGLRGFLFFDFIGGSMASAITNLTQIPMATMPYLSQYGRVGAAKALAKWTRPGAAPKDGSAHARDLKRAEEEGIVSPQEVYNLMATARGGRLGAGKVLSNRHVQTALYGWGLMFSMAEQYNRRATFNAAYEVALQRKENDPYQFAVKAVEETQFIYNRGNRPNWARGIGAPVFTFKQFTINYLEMFNRLPATEKAMMIALIILAAGIRGLPFEEDIEDIFDTIMQWAGYNWQTRREMELWAKEQIGERATKILLNGVSGAGIPIDVQSRLGFGNLIPGTALLKVSETDKGREVSDMFGASASVARNVGLGVEKAAKGDVSGALKMVAPKAARDVWQGINMLLDGGYRDNQDRMVTKTTVADAAAKMIGFQPERVAEVQRNQGIVYDMTAMHRAVEDGIADKWARGIVFGDRAMRDEARAELRNYNAKNPTMRIDIKPSQIKQRVKQLKQTTDQRTIKSAPREIRRWVKDEMQD